jgi:hypothetical protein
MRRYRLELVCESGEDEPEEAVLRTSADVARTLRPVFEKSDREVFVVVLLNALCRCRHNASNADLRIMPTSVQKPALEAAITMRGSA